MTSDSVQIHGGSGQPVLLLPGGAEACDGFFPGLPEGLSAAPGCRVIVYDRPGTGTSTENGSLAQAASQVNSLIKHLGYGPVVLVGQSLGGAVAVLLARDHPENVACLVLLDPTPINDPVTCARLERSMRVVGALTSVPVMHRLLSAVMRAAVKQSVRRMDLIDDFAAIYSSPWGFELAHVIVPVVWAHGQDDQNVPITAAARLAGQLPRCRFITWEHTGHAPEPGLQAEFYTAVLAAAFQPGPAWK